MKRAMLALVVAGGCVVLLLLTVGGAAGSTSTTAVTPAPKTPTGARAIGLVPASAAETATVVLRPGHEAALTRFIAAVTDSRSPLFHQYLAAGQYRARFGPTQSTIDAVGPIDFVGVAAPAQTSQFTYTVNSDSSISTAAPQSNPGLNNVKVCSVTGCRTNAPADYFYLYPPGNPNVDSVTPSSGPATGGTKVLIRGANLGCVTAVYFGTTVAARFSNKRAVLDCGSTNQVNATSPPGAAGSRVKVTVTTVESDFTGSGRSSSKAYFTYSSH